MGTRERKERELIEREQRFLDAAWALIREDGLLALQMTRVAEACDYATGTLYQHFSSKEDLLVALMTAQLRPRSQMFEKACAWQASTRERMFAVVVGDALFVHDNPDYFRLEQYCLTEVIWSAARPTTRAEHLQAATPIGHSVIQIVKDAIAAGDLDARGASAQTLSTGVWATCVGMHKLVHAEGVLANYEIDQPYAVLARHVQWQLNGMGWKPICDWPSDAALQAEVCRISREVFDA